MTYFGFLIRFLFIPILILLAAVLWDNRNKQPIPRFHNGRAVWIAISIHMLLAVLYTTPWDNYLVATGVWHYNPKLVAGIVLGYVPIEEYIFFVAETILAGLWWSFLARRSAPPMVEFKPNPAIVYGVSTVLISTWLIFTYLLFFGATKWTYLSITFFWALPVILLQLLFGADILWHYRKLVVWAILIPGAYLSFMDIVALKETTWAISKFKTTGILFFGILPLEEVVFFFITNMLIIFGMTLLLARESRENHIIQYVTSRIRRSTVNKKAR